MNMTSMKISLPGTLRVVEEHVFQGRLQHRQRVPPGAHPRGRSAARNASTLHAKLMAGLPEPDERDDGRCWTALRERILPSLRARIKDEPPHHQHWPCLNDLNEQAEYHRLLSPCAACDSWTLAEASSVNSLMRGIGERTRSTIGRSRPSLLPDPEIPVADRLLQA